MAKNIDTPTFVFLSFNLRTVIVDFEAVFDVVEVVEVELGRVERVLEDEDVLALEWLVRQKVLPVLGLDVQFLDGLTSFPGKKQRREKKGTK